MWFAKDTNGIRGWFRVQQSNGKLRTGLLAGDFTVTVRNPSDSGGTVPTVAESAKTGLYYFDIAFSFFTTNGVGDYGVVVEVDSKAGPSSPPHVVATFSELLRVNEKDFDDITSISFSGVADAVWDSFRIDHTATGTFGEYVNVDVVAIRNAIVTHVVNSNTLGLTLEEELDLIRKILDNRLELADGGAGSKNWVLYDDDDVTVARTWDVTDKLFASIVQPLQAPANRTRGAEGP